MITNLTRKKIYTNFNEPGENWFSYSINNITHNFIGINDHNKDLLDNMVAEEIMADKFGHYFFELLNRIDGKKKLIQEFETIQMVEPTAYKLLQKIKDTQLCSGWDWRRDYFNYYMKDNTKNYQAILYNDINFLDDVPTIFIDMPLCFLIEKISELFSLLNLVKHMDNFAKIKPKDINELIDPYIGELLNNKMQDIKKKYGIITIVEETLLFIETNLLLPEDNITDVLKNNTLNDQFEKLLNRNIFDEETAEKKYLLLKKKMVLIREYAAFISDFVTLHRFFNKNNKRNLYFFGGSAHTKNIYEIIGYLHYELQKKSNYSYLKAKETENKLLDNLTSRMFKSRKVQKRKRSIQENPEIKSETDLEIAERFKKKRNIN